MIILIAFVIKFIRINRVNKTKFLIAGGQFTFLKYQDILS